MAASTAARGDVNAAHTPSPVCLNNQPVYFSTASCNTESWASSADRMSSGSASHRRVDPSTSVNRNVTTPEGLADSPTWTFMEHPRTPGFPGGVIVWPVRALQDRFRTHGDLVSRT